MKKKYMEKLIGKYCKIVTKEPGDSRASVVTGTVEDIDYEDGFILVDSAQGLGCLSINTVVAIKPGHTKPKHQKRKLKAEETASIGIGTLIVFIALVLVAAVAASVIIQTSENLQNRAYAVGKQTIREVSSGVQIIGMTGYTNDDKTKMEYLALSVRPRAGSYDVDLNETLVYIQYDNLTVLSLDYANDDGAGAGDAGTISATVSEDGIFHTLNHSYLSATDYGIVAVRDSDNSVSNSYGMGTSDMVMIIINLTAAFSETQGLDPGEEFYGRLVPEVGAAGIFMVSAPNAFDHKVVDL
jgi:flagellin FlaB